MKLINCVVDTISRTGQVQIGEDDTAPFVKVSFTTLSDCYAITQFVGKDVRVEGDKLYMTDSTKPTATIIK
jgi:glutamate formiminotransferase